MGPFGVGFEVIGRFSCDPHFGTFFLGTPHTLAYFTGIPPTFASGRRPLRVRALLIKKKGTGIGKVSQTCAQPPSRSRLAAVKRHGLHALRSLTGGDAVALACRRMAGVFVGRIEIARHPLGSTLSNCIAPGSSAADTAEVAIRLKARHTVPAHRRPARASRFVRWPHTTAPKHYDA